MPSVGPNHTPDADDAEEWDFVGDEVSDSVVNTDYVPQICDAAHVPYKVQNEILALRKAALSGKQYQKVFTCGVGDAVGSAVYISADDTVATAKSDTSGHSKVFGFIAYKPTTTTCIVVHFYQVTVAGATAGSPVYLQDDGTFGPAPGTVSVAIGIALDATSALVFAGSLSPIANPSDLATKTYVDTQGASQTSAHGARWNLNTIEEEITLANAVTTDSVANLLPANSVIYGVCARVTGALLNARTWSLGWSGGAALYAQAGQSGVLGTVTNTNSTGTASPGGPAAGPLAPAPNPNGAAATKIRVTLSNADGGNGTTTKIRVCVIYATLTDLTS
jgi:hypothetical protein